MLHGSNLGSAEDLGRQLAEAGELRGFSTQVASLDDYAERLPANGAVAIVSASYNGIAPDNAVEFYRWLEAADDSLNGVAYSVFGCGNTDWAATYQAVPRRIDERLVELGQAASQQRATLFLERRSAWHNRQQAGACAPRRAPADQATRAIVAPARRSTRS